MAPADAVPSPCVCIVGADASAVKRSLTVLGDTPDRLLLVVPPQSDGDSWAAAEVVVGDGINAGTLATAAIAAAGRADVVLVPAGTVVAPGWLEGLAAASRESLVAMAFALTAAAVRVPEHVAFAESARCLAQRDCAQRPRVSGTDATCAYLTRSALDLIGSADATLETWEEVLTDLAQRAIVAGLVAVLADDVLVDTCHLPAADPDAQKRLQERYVWWAATRIDASAGASPAARAATRARRAAGPLTVTLDCRSLGPVRMGTQTHALGLALALAQRDDIALRALVAHDVDTDVADLLLSHPGTTLLRYQDALAEVPTTAVVHRPQQVNTADDITLLLPLGERLVITHQDLISYRNPAYHPSPDQWRRHRLAIRYGLAIADRTLFFTAHARDDALAEDLVDPVWTDVVGLGVDPPAMVERHRPQRLPATATDTGFLLCLGADLHHKNLPFAIDVLAALRAEHGWDGALVLAGPHLATGSSRAQEDARLDADSGLRSSVVRLGSVTEAEKHWLLENAAVVLYPTVDEGFGLLPFEAAAAGTPCAHAGTGALAEVLAEEEPTLVPWDASASAARVLALVTDQAARTRSLDAVSHAAQRHTWAETAQRIVAAYECVVCQPRRGVSWEARDRHTAVVEALRLPQVEDERNWLLAFRKAVGEDGARLVGPHALLDERDRRALLALVARPALRRPFLAALRAAYRAGHRP